MIMMMMKRFNIFYDGNRASMMIMIMMKMTMMMTMTMMMMMMMMTLTMTRFVMKILMRMRQ